MADLKFNRRAVISFGSLLIIGEGAEGQGNREGREISTAKEMRKVKNFSKILLESGLHPGDEFGLLDGSRYRVLEPGTLDADLPLPGDEMDQPLRVLDLNGKINFSAWGAETLTPVVLNGEIESSVDLSDEFTRAIKRAMKTGAELVLPPGIFRITRPGTFLSKDFLGRHDGLVITGSGRESTIVLYDPPDEEPLIWNNNSVIGIRLSRMTFHTNSPGATFARMFGNGVSQDHHFCDITWRGSWATGVELVPNPDSGNEGNNNSEFVFDRVFTAVYSNRFVLLSGLASDQNLNFWFTNCKLWGWITIAHLEKGGHVHVLNCDVSGYSPRDRNYLFHLMGKSHAQGVCSFSVRGLRVELKNNNALVLQSEWPSGNIEIAGLDLSSQTYRVKSEHPIIELFLWNGFGPIFSIRDSQISGLVRIHSLGVGESDNAIICFERVTFFHVSGPDQVILHEGSDAPRRVPNIIFSSCRSGHLSSNSVWNCNMGFLLGGACEAKKHHLVLPLDGRSLRLPKGAIVCDISSLVDFGDVEGIEVYLEGSDSYFIFRRGESFVSDGGSIELTLPEKSSSNDPKFIMLTYLA